MKPATLIAPMLLSACAGGADAPSLLPRSIEKPLVDRAPEPVNAADPAIAPRLVKLMEQATRGDRAFDGALPKARISAAPQSDAWATAQSAISAADLARGPTLDALTALDTLVTETFAAQRDPAAVAAARAQVQRMVDRQNDRLDALTRR